MLLLFLVLHHDQAFQLSLALDLHAARLLVSFHCCLSLLFVLQGFPPFVIKKFGVLSLSVEKQNNYITL